jgi:CRP-like cAMP-binding protein
VFCAKSGKFQRDRLRKHSIGMSKSQTLQLYLGQFISLSETEYARFESLLTFRELKARDVLTQIGAVEDSLYFVVSGLLRKYFYNGNQEIITHLGTPGHIISSSVSFLHQKPSDYLIDVVEDAEVWILRYPDFQVLLQQDIRFVRLARLVALEWLLQKEQMENDFLLLSSKERFIKFATEEPKLMATVPQRMLASYLNIQPETFSRYKHLLKA